jgi:hypothetical protein
MEFYLKWGSGIDDVRSVMEIAIAYRIIRKEGSWYEWPIGTESLRAQGVENLKKMILEKGKYDLLKEEAVKAIESAGGDTPDDSSEEDAADDTTNFETT